MKDVFIHTRHKGRGVSQAVAVLMGPETDTGLATRLPEDGADFLLQFVDHTIKVTDSGSTTRDSN